MKKPDPHCFLPVLLITLFGTSAICQVADDDIHRMRDGDVLNPMVSKDMNAIYASTQSRTNTDECDTTLRGIVEVFTGLFLDDEESARTVILSQCDTISLIRNGVRHIYVERNDTLGYLGYDSRKTKMRLDHAVPIMTYPLTDGVVLEDSATATVEHCQRSLLRHAVAKTISVTTSGWMSPDTETIQGSLLKLDWRINLRYDTLFNTGSNAGENIQEGISRTVTEWYSPYMRYPVIHKETTAAVRLDDVADKFIPSDTLMTLTRSYLLTPQQQYADTGENPEYPYDAENASAYTADNPDTGFPVAVKKVIADGVNLTVTMYGLYEQTVTVNAYVHTLSGILLAGPITKDVTPDETTLTMALSRDYDNISVLVLTTSDGLSQSYPIIH